MAATVTGVKAPKEPTITGPSGEKRPRDVIANAVHVCRVAVGLEKERYVEDVPKKRHRRKATAG